MKCTSRLPPAKVQVFITFWDVFLQLHSENCDSVKKKIQCVECGGNRLKLRFPIIILIYFHIAETLLTDNFCKSLQLLKEGQYQLSERSQSLEVWPPPSLKTHNGLGLICFQRLSTLLEQDDTLQSEKWSLCSAWARWKDVSKAAPIGTNQMLVDMNQSCYV